MYENSSHSGGSGMGVPLPRLEDEELTGPKKS